MTKRSQRAGAVVVGTAIFMLSGCARKTPAAVPPPPPVVTVAQPVVREVTDYDEFPGRVEALKSVDIRARVGGYLDRIFFQPGADVKEGDVLFQIDPRPFQANLDQAKAQLAQAQAALREREIEASRLTELLKTQAASPIETDRALAQRDAARAAVQAAQAAVEQAQLDLDYSTVKAPVSGRVSRNYVDVGNLVIGGQGQPTLLTRIVTLDPIYAYFNVDEQTVLRVRSSILQGEMKNYQETTIPVYLGLASDEGFPMKGRIDFVENRLDPETGTLTVRAIFDNKGTGIVRMLSPGMFARIRLQIGVPYTAVLVPERALGSDQGQRYLLVVDEKNVVEHRSVKMGSLHDGLRVIEKGLSPHEWVITHGLQRVRPGLVVEPRRTSSLDTQPAQTAPAVALGIGD